jgi:hypothetical protein
MRPTRNVSQLVGESAVWARQIGRPCRGDRKLVRLVIGRSHLSCENSRRLVACRPRKAVRCVVPGDLDDYSLQRLDHGRNGAEVEGLLPGRWVRRANRAVPLPASVCRGRLTPGQVGSIIR